MKSLTLAVVALLGGVSALVRPYTFQPDTTPTGCDKLPVVNLISLNTPCGMAAIRGVACPVVVPPKPNSEQPAEPCGTFVMISTLQDAQGLTQAIYGEVVGVADVGDAAFGLSQNGFKTLCPYSCVNAEEQFVKCATLPSDCGDTEHVRLDKMQSNMMTIPDISTFGDQELAYLFDGAGYIAPYRAGEIPATAVSRRDAAVTIPVESNVKNCYAEEDDQAYSAYELNNAFCGIGTNVPCSIAVNKSLSDQCYVAEEGECHDITFHREGIEELDRENPKFCSGGKCPTMSTITRRFKVDATYDEPGGPLYIVTPGAWVPICPEVCGSWDEKSDGEWAWACVQWSTNCVGSRTLPIWGVDFFGEKLRIPGSIAMRLDVEERKVVTCGSYNPNSSQRIAVPAALTIAAAAVVSVVYSDA